MREPKTFKFHYTPLVLSMLFSAIILGSIFYAFYYLGFGQTKTVNENQSNIPIQQTYTPSKEESINILLFGCEERNQSVSFVELLRFDAETMQIYAVSIPLNEYATVNVKTKSISEHYDYGGSKQLVSAVENLFLIHIQRYVRLDRYGIQRICDYFGGINFNFPTEFKTDKYSFDKSTNMLDGYRCADILLTGDLYINNVLISDLINTHFNNQLLDKLESFYSTFFENVDTDFSRFDLSALSRPIKLFLQKNSPKTTYLDYYSPEDYLTIKELFGE